MMITPTREEKRAIAALERLGKKWPKTLMLFVGDGVLHVMRLGENGELMKRSNCSVDSDYGLTSITSIPADGGGW